jgi:hypothetical protein
VKVPGGIGVLLQVGEPVAALLAQARRKSRLSGSWFSTVWRATSARSAI